MTEATLVPHLSDQHRKKAVENELGKVPGLNSSHLAVDAGSATLSGHVDSYPEMESAARAAFRVGGITSMAQEMTVRSLFESTTDDDIAHEAGRTLEFAVDIPDTVRVSVSAQEITLTGQVEWMFQSEASGRAMHNIKGVTNVVNAISITDSNPTSAVKGAIMRALLHDVELEGKQIQVTAGGDSTITLTGTVRSWAERERAGKTCWSAPGVVAVVNDLDVSMAVEAFPRLGPIGPGNNAPHPTKDPIMSPYENHLALVEKALKAQHVRPA